MPVQDYLSKLRTCRSAAIGMIAKMPTQRYFLGTTISRMALVEAPGLGTLAVAEDLATLRWDPEVVKTWTVKEIAGGWIHEVLHVLREHRP